MSAMLATLPPLAAHLYMSMYASLVAAAMNLLLGQYLMSNMPSRLSRHSCRGRRFCPSSRIYGLVLHTAGEWIRARAITCVCNEH